MNNLIMDGLGFIVMNLDMFWAWNDSLDALPKSRQ